MKRNTLFIIGAVLALLVIVGTVATRNKSTSSDMNMGMGGSSNMSGSSNNMQAAPNTVIIRDFAFGPDKLSIKKGTTITWTNQDDAKHNITPTSGPEDFKASELLSKGQSYTFTFNQVGTYAYKCSPHPYMKAMIEVTE